MCAQHLAGKRRREANDVREIAKRAEINAAKDAVEAKVSRLADFGIAADPDYSGFPPRYTGRVVLDPDDLTALLEGDAK